MKGGSFGLFFQAFGALPGRRLSPRGLPHYCAGDCVGGSGSFGDNTCFCASRMLTVLPLPKIMSPGFCSGVQSPNRFPATVIIIAPPGSPVPSDFTVIV